MSGLLCEGGTTKGPKESMVSKFNPWAPTFAKRAAYPEVQLSMEFLLILAGLDILVDLSWPSLQLYNMG